MQQPMQVASSTTNTFLPPYDHCSDEVRAYSLKLQRHPHSHPTLAPSCPVYDAKYYLLP